MPVYTVLGPVEPTALGPTSMHEHVLCDTRVWLGTPVGPPPRSDRVELATLGHLRWNVTALEDNLRLDDPQVAVAELREAERAGAGTVVDLTVVGIGRDVARLPDVARRTGVHLVTGCGFYLDHSHPEWLADADIEELAELLVRELTDGVGDTGVRPGLIGEIGTGHPVTDDETKVLRAAGRAGAATGAAVSIHLDRRGRHALEVVDLLGEEGLPPERVVLGHMDYQPLELSLAAARTGATVEFDTFGSEAYYGSLAVKDPSDAERCALVRAMVDNGFADRLVLGCDVWAKTSTTTYGGMGYQHLFGRIAPALVEQYGVAQDAVEAMLVTSPQRLLDRPAV